MKKKTKKISKLEKRIKEIEDLYDYRIKMKEMADIMTEYELSEYVNLKVKQKHNKAYRLYYTHKT